MAPLSTSTLADQVFLIATTNQGKRRELTALLDDFLLPRWQVLDRRSFPEELPEVEETAHSFEGNAVKKALETALATGCCVLADDSGLEVDALGGAPGIYSARFAGAGASDEENNAFLLEKLKGVSPDQRGARFVAVLCLALPNNQVTEAILARRGWTFDDIVSGEPEEAATPVQVDGAVVIWFRATLEGQIALQARGDQGFGYDPYFLLPDQQRTLAELSKEEKNLISHRARAARAMAAYF